MAAASRSDRRQRIERGIYQQPNGKYAVCVRVDRRARFRTLEATTLIEALRQRELLQNTARIGELPLSPRLTFAEVAARWLAEFEAKVAAGERRDRTLDLYRSQLRRHLLPRLGRRRLAMITADDVVAVTRELQADGLSPWTVKRMLGALSCVFTFALRRGYVTTHPFQRLERDERPHPLRSDQRVLTRTELARFFTACPRRYRPLLITGAYTGMRLSEVLGLSWEDVDFAASVIHVRHQLARGSDYVFATSRGSAFLHHNVSKRVLRRAAVDASLDRDGRRLRFHDLRHTFASHLIIDIRLDVAQVSGILGHARTSMTLDTYTHLFEQAAHGADVRAQLAQSDFANLLSRPLEPRLLAAKQFRGAPAGIRRRLSNSSGRRRRCCPRSPASGHCYVTKNVTKT